MIARKARALFSAYFAYMSAYRAELFLWALAGLMPFVMMGIWMEAADATGRALAFSRVEVQRYFIAVFIARQMATVWVIWEFEYHVITGRLSPLLLHPIDVIWRFLAQHAADQVIRVPFGLGLVAVFFFLYPEALWWPGWRNLGLALLAVWLAFAMRFLLQYSLAMLCFWLERAGALEQLLFLPYLFLSGMLAPLNQYPPLAREIALWTPFPYMLYFPAQLAMGIGDDQWHIPPVQGFAVMIAWTCFFALLNRWLWRRGLKHYSAMGA